MICSDCGKPGRECTCDIHHYVRTGEKRSMVTKCSDCGINIKDVMHISNVDLGYVKCLKCGLGVERSENQP